VAKKPLSDLSAAYRRRIERAEAKGLSRQQARGHKAKEHVFRNAREIEKTGFTNSQSRTIYKWYGRQDKHTQSLFDADEIKEHFAENYEGFKHFREKRRQLETLKLREGYKKSGLAGREWLASLAVSIDVPTKWMWY